MNLSVPANYDLDEIDFYSKNSVKDCYGSVREFGFTVRKLSQLPKTSKTNFRRYISLLHKNNITFTYLLNSPIIKSDEKSTREINDILTFLKRSKVDRICIADFSVIELIKRYFPGEKITVSVVARVKSAKEIEDINEKYGITNFILDPSLNKNITLLKKIIKLINTFRRCSFYIPLDNTHYSSSQIKKVKNSSFADIITTISKKKNCKLILIINLKKCEEDHYYASKVLQLTRRRGIEFRFDSSLKERVPLPYNNPEALRRDFRYFYKKSKRMWPIYRARQLITEMALGYEFIYMLMYILYRKLDYLKLFFLSMKR
jgi:hypothetical protein